MGQIKKYKPKHKFNFKLNSNSFLKNIGKLFRPFKKLLKYIQKPITTYLQKRATKLVIVNLKKTFSKDFKVNYDAVKTLIDVISLQQTDVNVLKADLIHGAKLCPMSNKAPTTFDPEIVNIHNENLNPSAPTLKNLITVENANSEFLLKEQLKKADAYYGNSTRVRREGPPFENLYTRVTAKDIDDTPNDTSINRLSEVDAEYYTAKLKDFMKNVAKPKE